MADSRVITVHYGEQPPADLPIMYFFGPTNFSDGSPSWHDEGVEYIRELHHPCAICIPSPRGNNWHDEDWRAQNAQAQNDWQFAMQDITNIKLFWVNRPGNMTCMEFGAQCERMRWQDNHVVIGIPPNTPGTGCFRDYAKKYKVPVESTLRATIDTGFALLG